MCEPTEIMPLGPALFAAISVGLRFQARVACPRALEPTASAVTERVLAFPLQSSGFGLTSPSVRTAAEGAMAVPSLPLLTEEEHQKLLSGERLRWQQPPSEGGIGSGFAVCEVRADADEVWRAVSAFDRYSELISTVRTAELYEGAEDDPPAPGTSVCRYSFLVSRIRLKLDVRFTVDNGQRFAMWQLDRQSWVLSDSTGYWHVQQLDDRPEIVRVWFCVTVKLSKRVPGFVVRLVSRLGLDKATRWLKALETSCDI